MATATTKSAQTVNTTNVITDLAERSLKLKIFKVKRMENETDKSAFFLISAYNLESKETLTLSISELMLNKFEFSELIKEGVFITEDKPAIYAHCNAVFVPNDGNQYGYKDRDGNVQPYKANNTYIIKQFHGTVSKDYIQAYEQSELKGNESKLKADTLFLVTKGRPFIAGVSETDTEYYISLFTKM